MKRSRKRHSDKFLLTLHPTGHYCKKIKGKIRYFGTDKKKTLERYRAQVTYLHEDKSLIQEAVTKNIAKKTKYLQLYSELVNLLKPQVCQCSLVVYIRNIDLDKNRRLQIHN